VPELVPQQPPPPDYYAENLRYVLGEVSRRSGELLGDRERRFIRSFESAGVAAQRLFARLVSRTGPWLRVDSLRYAEVDDLPQALETLCRLGLAEWNPAAPADALLPLLRRAELDALFPAVRARTKGLAIEQCVTRYPDTLIRRRVAATCPWVGVGQQQAFLVCLVLFFGGDDQDLSTFVLQDLGLVRYERYPLRPDTRPFRSRRELERYLLCRRLSPASKRLDETPALAGAIRRALWPFAETRTEQRARDRVLNRVGYWHERRGELAEALACYERSTSHPARERRARILRRLGDEDAVARLLAEMRADPWAPEEEDFAARFATGGRTRRAVAVVTECRLPGPTPPAIERHALALLTANGGRGWHLENLLPLGLAGLAFWDEIFAPVEGAFSHPFQLGPRDLFWPDFARARRAALERRARSLYCPRTLATRLRSVHAARCGTANRLVHWGAITPALLEALLDHVPAPALARLAEHTIFNLHRSRSGFPDLLVVYGRGAWELVEVKGPTDQLQPAQRVWLDVLRGLDMPARVLRFRAPC
jgi:hypothetical protein